MSLEKEKLVEGYIKIREISLAFEDEDTWLIEVV